jgi:4-diphosphocytidyl-2-C-methyl-D-erythritol kinase
MSPVRAVAPAKLNLALAVGAPRSDGFHEVATVYHAVSLYDEVVASAGTGLTVTVEGAKGVAVDDVPQDTSNLAARAARMLAQETGQEPNVHLHIRKGIPVAGGMAGGSADAAAALVACDALWGTALPRPEMLDLAARLGSDVPFSVVGGTALGVGRGERLTPALARGRFEWVFALADGGLSTPRVYAECDRLRAGRVLPEPRIADEIMAALRSGDSVALGKALHNDLQPAACSLRPVLRQTLEVGEDCAALGSIVSGSGPTVAFLARDKEHSLDIAVALSASGTCRSVKRAQGPVTGARLGEER